MKIACVCGGVGAARMLDALCRVADPAGITAVVNVGDDTELHGLHISPDLDTVAYTLSGRIDPERGWGLAGETWTVMERLRELGGLTWFNLGDRDLATHCYRTQRLAEGATLSQVTAELAAALGVPVTLLPATDERLRTVLTLERGGTVTFQEYFVRLAHAVPVRSVAFEGAGAAPAPGVLEALAGAELVVICPSNPVVSIDPVLAVAGVRDALSARRDSVVAVSPLVGGAALKGPADRLMAELGESPTVAGIAARYAGIAGTLVVDALDAESAADVGAAGMAAVVTDTVMAHPGVPESLAAAVLGAGATR